MQTGGSFFKELTKNAVNKMEKLVFIKTKLESLKTNASEQSKPQIIEQLKIINEMITEMEKHDIEVKNDPNIICRRTEDLKNINKNIRERIL
jgi:shikimate kinase